MKMDSIVQGPSTEFPRSSNVAEELFRTAARHPRQAALRCEGVQVSYEALCERVESLALAIRAQGLGDGQLIGLFGERCIETIVAMFAIMRAGSAYVPVDPALADDHNAELLRSVGVTDLLSTCGRQLRDFSVVDRTGPASTVPGFDPPGPQSPAYVLFTSGTTGQPKAVCVAHRALLRYAFDPWHCRVEQGDRVLHMALLTFDASTSEIFKCLLFGGTLVILPSPRPSLNEIAEALQAESIDVAMIPAGTFHTLVSKRVDALSGLRQAIVGGEVLSPRMTAEALRVMRAGRGKTAKVTNGYGPTEAVVLTTAAHYSNPDDISEDGTLSIGTPHHNTRAYVLDEFLAPLPVGVVGELYIGGEGLALGYINSPESTAERFLPDPFGASGSRMYKTGDLVRLGTDQRLYFVGRTDTQVKISGIRIELEAVEAALCRLPGIAQCAVVARQDSPESSKYLIAFYVGSAPQEPVAAIREQAAARLRDVLVPRHWVELDHLPLRANGKVHRGELPLHEVGSATGQVSSDRAGESLRVKVAEIWRESLPEVSTKASSHDLTEQSDFFLCGGDSLVAVDMTVALGANLEVSVPVTLLFQNPTLGAFTSAVAQLVERQNAGQ